MSHLKERNRLAVYQYYLGIIPRQGIGKKTQFHSKNWQTLVYVRIKKTIHKIKVDADLGVAWYNNTGKTATLLPESPPILSYNMKDLCGIQDLFKNEILNKNLWSDIITGIKVTVDLNKIKVYVFMHDRFIEPIVGKITYKYLRTESKNF